MRCRIVPPPYSGLTCPYSYRSGLSSLGSVSYYPRPGRPPAARWGAGHPDDRGRWYPDQKNMAEVGSEVHQGHSPAGPDCSRPLWADGVVSERAPGGGGYDLSPTQAPIAASPARPAERSDSTSWQLQHRELLVTYAPVVAVFLLPYGHSGPMRGTYRQGYPRAPSRWRSP